MEYLGYEPAAGGAPSNCWFARRCIRFLKFFDVESYEVATRMSGNTTSSVVATVNNSGEVCWRIASGHGSSWSL